jgi:hypothetical protein
MLPIRLSDTEKFKGSLILSAKYIAPPIDNGNVELAIFLQNSKMQIWSWRDKNIENISELPVTSNWRDIATFALYSEIISSGIRNLDGIKIFYDTPPLGQLLGFAMTDNDQDKLRAKLLLTLSDRALLVLCSLRNGLYHSNLLTLLDNIIEKISDEMIEIEDFIQKPKLNKIFNIIDLEQAFVVCIKQAIKNIEGKNRLLENKLTPLKMDIDRFLHKWSSDKPKRRYPAGGNLPALGQVQLMRYIKEFIIKNGDFPRGIHFIPKGTDIFNKEAIGFEINFDDYR